MALKPDDVRDRNRTLDRDSDEFRHELAQGAQVVLTGEARDAARGAHSTIEHNIAARDAAIADGHVVPETSRAAVTDTLRASIGAPLSADPDAEAERVAREHAELTDRAKVAGETMEKQRSVVMSPPAEPPPPPKPPADLTKKA
jgi:hypothetical protein